MARLLSRSILHHRHIDKEISIRVLDIPLNPFIHGAHGVRCRKLEVILTTTIDKLGKSGETVKVAPGFFRNYLMPRLLAVPNIEKFARLVREQRKIFGENEEVQKVVEDDKENKMKEYRRAAGRLENTRLVLKRFSKPGNEIRTPVDKDELLAEVRRQLCVKIEPGNLHLPSPLSSFGEFEVPLRLPKSIPLPPGKLKWTLKVKIRKM